DLAPAHPPRGLRRLPDHGRHPPRRCRGRGARAARAPARHPLRGRRHDRQGHRRGAPPGRRTCRVAVGRRSRRRRRRPQRSSGTAPRGSGRETGRDAGRRPHPPARARVPRGRRGDPRAARRRRPRVGLPARDRGARRPRRLLRLLPRPHLRAA
ncbi:MAG: ATP-dependent protease La Type I, partial [uncultured Solirubrobacteraceae bacterium]